MKKINFILISLFLNVVIFGQVANDPSCTSISNFTSSPSGSIAKITVDAANNYIYYTTLNTNTALYRADMSGNTVVASNPFNNSPVGFHPYIGTDIEYHNGYIYSVDGSYRFFRADVSTGAGTLLPNPSGMGYENGIAAVGDDIYFTDGNGSANSIFRYSTTGGGITTVVTGLPSTSYETLEYNAATNTLYYGSYNTGLYRVNLGSGTLTHIASSPGAYGSFAIDPPGDYAYWFTGSTITRIDLTSGATSSFITSNPGSSNQDLEFAVSSSGSGYSLYFGANNIMKELDCPQFDVATQPIPTLSQWGLIIFTLLLLGFGTVAVWTGRYGYSKA